MSNKLKVVGMPIDDGYRFAPVRLEDQPASQIDELTSILETKYKVGKKSRKKLIK